MDIKKLFIANRGEIAVRIARSAHDLGIATVGIQQKGRAKAYLSSWLDEVIEVEDETIALYLDPAAMIDCAKRTGCDAIHPGFGFLSENADFAQQVSDAGIIWVGPGSEAISQMASKEKARAIAEQLKVPVVPGISDIVIADVEKDPKGFCAKVVDQVGLPVLIKAAYGGGGKGMRVCEAEDQLLDLIKRASSEAQTAFGDGTLIIEKFLPTLRHVEVQVLADSHGEVRTIGTRDCSLQRRHQKIVEEAPAPFLSEAITAQMEDCAVRLAQHVGYASAGTVEYLVAGNEFYFLEMNTRLQVEHPVTEEVYDIDLVAWQLKIAMGASLKDLGEVKAMGHAVEVRLYAEDPASGFLPSSGTVYGFINGGVDELRCELGLDTVDQISDRFDPMVGKLISYGSTRDAALDELSDALSASLIAGPKTNCEFLEVLLDHPSFRSEGFDTGTVGTIQPAYAEALSMMASGVEGQDEDEEDRGFDATARELVTLVAPDILSESAPLAQPTAERARRVFAAPAAERQVRGWSLIEQSHHVGAPYLSKGRGFTSRLIEGNVTTALGEQPFVMVASHEGSTRMAWVKMAGQVFSFKEEPYKNLNAAGRGGGSDQLISPVPGKVFTIGVAAGDAIEDGQVLMVIESMKMEFEIRSEKTGTIKEVLVNVGDQVEPDQLLITLQNSGK